MAQATHQDKAIPLSALFESPHLRAVFARAERDTPPQALAVEPEPNAPTLMPGAAERVLEMA